MPSVTVIEETIVVVSVRVTSNDKFRSKVVATVWVGNPVAVILVVGNVSVIGTCCRRLMRTGCDSKIGRGVMGVAPWAAGLAVMGAWTTAMASSKPRVTIIRLIAIRLIILRVIG